MQHIEAKANGVDPRIWGLDPLEICRRGQSIIYPLKMSHSFIQNCWWITADFTSSRTNTIVSKMEGKTTGEAHTGCQEPGLLSVWKSLTAATV